MPSPKILTLCGSTRGGSLNQKLMDCAVKQLVQMNCEVTRISLLDYALPIYDGDLEADTGIPQNAIKLARQFHNHDGILFISPEYNGSLTPLIKNTIDWVSRVKNDQFGDLIPYKGKICAIGAASPGSMGGISMLYHMRDILFRLGLLVISEQVAVGGGADAFTDNDTLSNQRAAGILDDMLKSLVEKSAMIAER